MTVVMKRKYCTEISSGRLSTITQDTEKCSSVILNSEIVQKMWHCTMFWVVSDKDVIQQIVRENSRYAEQYKNAQGKLFSFTSLVRSRTPVTESEIYTVLGVFLLISTVQKPTVRSYFLKRRVISTTFHPQGTGLC